MTISSVVISAGHGKYVAGACGIIDEHIEAVRVVDAVGKLLKARGVAVKTFEDTTSYSQDENLHTIVNFHNAQVRDLDVSIHFNAYEQVDKPMGCEVLYTTQKELATTMSAVLAEAGGFIDRGAKQRTDLYFLNQTQMPAILIEVCFVDSKADCELYENNFDDICAAISGAPDEEQIIAEYPVLFNVTGPCSYFGGPKDAGVDVDEGLAFIDAIDDAPWLFLPEEAMDEDTGLARRLNPFVHYVACRWDYAITPKPTLIEHVALVRSVRTGRALKAFPADWGPHEDTGRVADLSPSLLMDLELETDDEVEVVFPFEAID